VFIKAEMEEGRKMAKTTSYFHPDEPNADSLLGLSICPLGAESIGFTTKYKAFARLHGT